MRHFGGGGPKSQSIKVKDCPLMIKTLHISLITSGSRCFVAPRVSPTLKRPHRSVHRFLLAHRRFKRPSLYLKRRQNNWHSLHSIPTLSPDRTHKGADRIRVRNATVFPPPYIGSFTRNSSIRLSHASGWMLSRLLKGWADHTTRVSHSALR